MEAIGIDIGGSAIKAGLVGGDGALLDHASALTPPGGAPDDLLARLGNLVAQLPAKEGVRGIGVSVAGFLSPGRGAMSYNANLPALSGFPLRDRVAALTGHDVALEVDSSAGALAEHRFGAGKGSARLLFVTVGTGVGVAMLVGGAPLRFTGECAGDPGHVIVAPGGRLCPCGARGCAEAVAAAPALEEASGRPVRELIDRARAGEVGAADRFRTAGRHLGVLVASLAHLFEPDRVVIGGGIATVGEPLIGAAAESFLANASPHFSRGVAVLPARFNGHEGVIGAASLFL